VSQTGRALKEEVLNAFSHLPIALVAGTELLAGNPNRVFLFFSVLTFFFSFLYHITSESRLKVIFRRLDIASIFWLVPASIFYFVPMAAGLSVLALCIILSVPVIKSGTSTIFTDVALITLTVSCLMMVFLFSSAWKEIGLGVFFYGLGLPFYFNDEKRWSHFVWHIFVIAGWTTHLWAHL
jgi:hemolysin III